MKEEKGHRMAWDQAGFPDMIFHVVAVILGDASLQFIHPHTPFYTESEKAATEALLSRAVRSKASFLLLCCLLISSTVCYTFSLLVDVIWPLRL